MAGEAFNAKQGLVIVSARIFGPSGDTLARLAVDTGALTTLVDPRILTSVGYDVAQAPGQARLVSASGILTVPRLLAEKVTALGQERTYLPIIAHTLPPATGVDGVLALDFYRARRLTVNFRRGRVSLA
ncbi:MAG: hypothetical protein JO250_07420 [Armatimonadetes bacterium]|nr:hypothetical protein [Armatimonadota bacterium]